MYKYNFKFIGSFWEFLGVNLGLGAGAFITFGIVAPYWIFWNIQYFVDNVEITKEKVK